MAWIRQAGESGLCRSGYLRRAANADDKERPMLTTVVGRFSKNSTGYAGNCDGSNTRPGDEGEKDEEIRMDAL
jgi:hypothetical protein